MWRHLTLSIMNSGPASRTNGRNFSETKRSKRSNRGPSISKIPDEIVQLILEYVALFDGSIELRLVCRRFDAILSSLLLSSISIFPSDEYYEIEFQMNGSTKSAVTQNRINTPFCPIDSHIRHVTINLSLCYGDYDTPTNIRAYEGLRVRVVKHIPGLKAVKLLHNLNDMDSRYGELEGKKTGMNTLITHALNCFPRNIHIEVELAMLALGLDSRLVSVRPAHWTSWQNDVIQSSLPIDRTVIERWPKAIEEIWGMVDSLDIRGYITRGGGHPGIGEIAEKCISNWHIIHLFNYMIPGPFLTLQFPNGFPVYLKKLHLRDPLIVNCTQILHFLRDCQYLEDLSLFVVLNIEEAHEGHGLPPALETLELFESGGTILPTRYDGLRQFRYTFIGEPSEGDMNTVRQFIEHSHVPRLELNIVTSRDFSEITPRFCSLAILSPPGFLGRYLLQEMSCDYYQFNGRGQSFCHISKRATRSMKEYIITLAKSS
uniref:ARAD1B15642p n=1 Tax=Blastobotrys adeninivorans TaxID=409370 RepID=A0A060TCC9_BLAAD